MQIDKQEFLNFLKKIEFCVLEGDGTIFEFKENGNLHSYGSDKPTTTAYLINFNNGYCKSATPSTIGIKNLRFLVNSVKLFNLSVNLTIVGNKIVLTEFNKEIQLTLIDPKLIDAHKMSKLPPYEHKFEIETKKLKEISNATKTFGQFLEIIIRDKNVAFKTGTVDILTETLPNLADTTNIKLKIQSVFFQNLVEALSEDKVAIYYGTDIPLRVVEEGEDFCVEYFIMLCGD